MAAAASPKAALALLRKLELMVGVSVDVSELEEAAGEYEHQVGLAVQSDPDIQAFVERWSAGRQRASRRPSARRICPPAICWRANSSASCATRGIES